MPKEKRERVKNNRNTFDFNHNAERQDYSEENPDDGPDDMNSKMYLDARAMKIIAEESKNLLKESSSFEEEGEEFGNLNVSSSEQEVRFDEENEDNEEERAYEKEPPIEIDLQEEALIEKFLTGRFSEKLSSVLNEKLSEHEQKNRSMNNKVKSAYKKLGTLLCRYRSGKLPKALTILPNLSNWEDVIFYTNIPNWTNHVYPEITSVFASSANIDVAQRFFNLILLPKLRSAMSTEKKLQFHLYTALKKTLRRPAAFYKGIILPLCESGTCTSLEAITFASVLRKYSVPVLHSSAALMKLCQMPYRGTTSYFIKVLIEKRYALPTKVIEALCQHFTSFLKEDERQLPVLWHQTLLSFVQIYSHEISKAWRAKILLTSKKHSHYYYSPLIKKQLNAVGGSIKKRTNKITENVPVGLVLDPDIAMLDE